MSRKLSSYKNLYYCNLKWIFGIFFVLFFWISGFLFLLTKLNNQEFIKIVIYENIDTITGNENFQKYYNDLLANLISEPGEKIIFWDKISFSKEEIINGNFETFKLNLAEKIYTTYFLEKEKLPDEFPLFLKILSAITKYKFQKEIKYCLKTSLILLVISGSLLLFFSFAFGKILALGLGAFIGSLPFYVIFIYFQKEIENGNYFYKRLELIFFDFFTIFQILMYFSFSLIILGILAIIGKKIYDAYLKKN